MKKKVILELYELYKNNCMDPTQEYKRLLKKFNKTREQINLVMTEEQQEKVSQLVEQYGQLTSEEKQEYFITGFKLAMGIAMEVR